ncbi:hypothetical protein CF8_1376 [Nocardioides sp. CF8]|uniref:DUF2231 domain-containing protein n=1 Tax=Nocardioides sp. CF8 TaxID=110319 RepID=UPI000330556B|nr:DUF2231 domain-containing protein [Nocardioides sp. CF8]EON24625.1 hypothetical protein CF8_1376 [Nocardioides sp. CF8]
MEINGLPLHPLVVHAVVILGPLAALAGLAYALLPRWRWLLRWPLVALSVAVAITAVVAVQAGESLLDARPELEPLVEDHEEWGELLRTWSLTFVVDAVLAAWALGGPSALASGRGARETKGILGWIAMALLVGGAIGLLVLVFLTGDSGARAVWGQ